MKKNQQNFNEFEFYVDIEFESLPKYCGYCGFIGHEMSGCRRRGAEEFQQQFDQRKTIATEGNRDPANFDAGRHRPAKMVEPRWMVQGSPKQIRP